METAFDAELNRLLARNLTENEVEIARRYYSDKERASMDESSFCGPHKSFPIQSQEDVDNAAHLVGHADDPAAVKSCIINKAHAHGWSLPDAWQEEKSDQPETTRASSKEEPSPETPEIVRTLPSETTIFAPILRIDQRKREVVVRATAEDLDSYETVIGFDGSKAAFSKWRGNIREMHDPAKAVGRAIHWEPVEEEKAIDLTLRVSRGSEDTWQKVLDGTLSGASIGARNGVWGKRVWKGKEVPYLERYDLVEVSLVDNPSCPGCDIKIVRADGMATDILDYTEESEPAEKVERVGARLASSTMSSMHKSRDHALAGVREMLSNCGCPECHSALKALDPDMDGDIDIIGSLDTDNDYAGGDAASGDGSGVMKAAQAEFVRYIQPFVQRLNAIAARLSTTSPNEESPDIQRRAETLSKTQTEMNRRLETLEQKLTGIDEVRSIVIGVKDLTERIAAQPQAGGPVVNSAVMRQAPAANPSDSNALEAEVIARLARSGILNKDQQVNAVMYLQKLQQQGMSARR